MIHTSIHRDLIGILIAAFVVHTALVFVALPLAADALGGHYRLGHFADGNDRIAMNLVQGHGYRSLRNGAPTMVREPGYPLYLALVFKVFGKDIKVVQLLNIVLAMLTALVVARLAEFVSPHRFVRLAAPVALLTHPGLIVAEARGGFEVVFILFLSLSLLLFYRALQRNTVALYVAAGTLLGLSTLIRSSLMLIPAGLLLAMLIYHWRTPALKQVPGRFLALLLPILVVVSPWVVRNYMLVGTLVPGATVSGIAAYTGQYMCEHRFEDQRTTRQLDSDAAREINRITKDNGFKFRGRYYRYFFDSKDELALNTILLNTVATKYRESPALFAKCLALHAFDFWFTGSNRLATMANVAIQLPFLLLLAAGIYLSIRSGQFAVVFPLIMVIGYFVLLHIAIHAQARYSVQVLPFASIFVAISLNQLWLTVTGRKRRRSLAPPHGEPVPH